MIFSINLVLSRLLNIQTMKNYTICFFFLPLSLFSQMVTVSEALTIRNDAAYDILGDIKGNLLLLRDKTTEFEVQCFNQDLHLKWEKEIELDKRRPEIVGVLPTVNDFSVLYLFKRKGDLILKIHKYDAAANLIDSISVKNYSDLFYSPSLKVIRSEDKSKLLIFYVDKQNEYNVIVFDVITMELLWEKRFEPADVVHGRDFRQMLVDNEGNMHLIQEMENRKPKLDEHHFMILEYGLGSNDRVRNYTINMPEHLTYDVYFSFDNLNERLVAGGLYSVENRGRAEGFYYLNVSPTAPFSPTFTFHPFSDDFVATLLEKSKNKNKGVPEVNVQEVVLRRDGGILLIGELNKKFERRAGPGNSNYNRGGSPHIVDYYYDDLFVISLHPTGDIHWKNVLHKKQFSQDDDAIYSSYFLMKTPTALRLIFNDEIKYENTVSEYVIKGDGAYDRNAVMSTENQQLRLRFRDAVQIGANEILVPSERRSRLKLIKVVFERKS